MRIITVFDRHDVAGFSLVIEVQPDQTSIKLPQDTLDSPLDGGIVCAVATDEFLDDGPERRWLQFLVWDTH